MGLRDDLERFREVGEDNRMDLEDFIKHGQMGEDIQIPIKIVSLPEFVYDPLMSGGVAQAEQMDVDEDDFVEPIDEDGDGEGEAGEDPGEHGYYEMDPEEFAEELDDELDLDLDPKGKKVIEKTIGDMVEVAQAGPRSALDVDYLFTEALKRKVAMWYDEEFLREACKVSSWGPDDVFEYVRMEYSMPVDRATVGSIWEDEHPPHDAIKQYESIEDVEDSYGTPRRSPPAHEIDRVPIRDEDERYRHPEVVEERQKNVVVVNIRDVSGSMHGEKRDLVERVFTPMDWYLQGKYENAEFVYIAHDAEAWEVDRDDFFGIESGGGTQVSTAYLLAQEILESRYPWTDWNRYVFGAGDGENWGQDTRDNVVPLVKDIDANLHAYVEVLPQGSEVIAAMDDEIQDDTTIETTEVNSTDDVIPAIEQILSAASSNQTTEDT